MGLVRVDIHIYSFIASLAKNEIDHWADTEVRTRMQWCSIMTNMSIQCIEYYVVKIFYSLKV